MDATMAHYIIIAFSFSFDQGRATTFRVSSSYFVLRGDIYTTKSKND